MIQVAAASSVQIAVKVGLALLSVLKKNLVLIHVTFLKNIDFTHFSMHFLKTEAEITAHVSFCVPDPTIWNTHEKKFGISFSLVFNVYFTLSDVAKRSL